MSSRGRRRSRSRERCEEQISVPILSIPAIGAALLLDEDFVDGIIFDTLLEVVANPPNSLLITPPAAPGDPLGIGITITADPASSIVVTQPTALTPGQFVIGDTLAPGFFQTTFQLDWKPANPVISGPKTSLIVPVTFSKINRTVTVIVGNNNGALEQTAFPAQIIPGPPVPTNVTVDSIDTPVAFPTPDWAPDQTVNGTIGFGTDAGMSTIVAEDQNVYQGGSVTSTPAEVRFQTDATNTTYAFQWVPGDTFNDIVWNAINAAFFPTDVWEMPQFTFQYISVA